MRLSNALALVAALSPLTALVAHANVPATRLPIIENDYAKARALAIRGKRPMFVDVWAPW